MRNRNATRGGNKHGRHIMSPCGQSYHILYRQFGITLEVVTKNENVHALDICNFKEAADMLFWNQM